MQNISKTFEIFKIIRKIEESGSNISYRCMKCRNCLECKKGSLIEEVSIQDEMEQHLIDKSVDVDIAKHISKARLPFTSDPVLKLSPTNRQSAQKVYNSQVKKLAKSPKDLKDVIEAEAKLHNLGYVDYIDNLVEEDRNMILNAPVKYFIPWRVVWSKSLSTPVRPVFDASSCTSRGCSLNDILAKGTNNMNNLVQILLRWTIHSWAYHTDIRTMYNRVHLEKDYWCYQLYLWGKKLEPSVEPSIKVIKTLIYGVRSSGIEAERAIRVTAEKNSNMYPEACDVICNDTYVDDVISGTCSEREGLMVTDQLKLCLETGGFSMKGLTHSGKDPDEKLSADKKSVSVGGLKWYPKEDYLKVNIEKLISLVRVGGENLNRLTIFPKT